MTQATIKVRFQHPAWHCWPGAPEHRAYLAALHRHVFHVEVAVPVVHDDRAIEFHDLRDIAIGLFAGQGEARPFGTDLAHRSCEMLARHMAEALARMVGQWCEVSVSEDGEFGAVVRAGAGA